MNNKTGIIYAVSAFFMVAVTHIIVKAIGNGLPLAEVMSFRFLFGLMFLYPAIRKQGGWRKTLQTNDTIGMIYRAALGLAWIGMTFYALRFLPVAPATAIWASAPLLVAALSGVVLREHVSPRQWFAILIGLVGVLIIARPESLGTDNVFAIVLMVLASFAAALSNLQVRKLTFSNNSLTIVCWYFLAALVPCAVLMIPSFILPNLGQMALLAALGVSSGLMMMLNTQAYRHLPAANVAIYEYSVIVWTALFGWSLFGEQPTMPVIIGSCLIILAGIAIMRLKNKVAK